MLLSDLRRRAEKMMGATQRYSFLVIVCVSEGECEQIADFRKITGKPGTLLVLRPGQVHSFGRSANWDGWLISFRPEFIVSAGWLDPEIAGSFERIPACIMLNADQARLTGAIAMRMRVDAGGDVSAPHLHALLRRKVYTFLLRLSIPKEARGRELCPCPNMPTVWLVERSLTRATMEATGVNAKAIVAARIVLAYEPEP